MSAKEFAGSEVHLATAALVLHRALRELDVEPALAKRYRQWTLSLPFRLRWLALKHPPLLDFVLKALLQRVWALQRRLARRLGVPGRLHPGAVSFTQYFGSTLQLTPPRPLP